MSHWNSFVCNHKSVLPEGLHRFAHFMKETSNSPFLCCWTFSLIETATHLWSISFLQKEKNLLILCFFEGSMALGEIKNLKKLPKHPNLVQYRGYHFHSDSFWIAMEFCDMGDLSEYYRRYYPEKIPLAHQIHFMYQVILLTPHKKQNTKNCRGWNWKYICQDKHKKTRPCGCPCCPSLIPVEMKRFPSTIQRLVILFQLASLALFSDGILRP